MVEKTIAEPSQRESEHDAAVDSNTQPLLTHLIALRNAIIRSLVAMAILFVPYVIFAKQLFALIAMPLVRSLPGSSPETVGTMISTEVAAPFIVPLKLAFFLALITAMPYILHQVWTFISPGLYLREKRFALPLLFSSILLFFGGMVFAYFLVFPLIFQFFAASTPDNVVWMTDINSYLSFIFKLFFAFGIVFEIPIAIVLLTATRLTTIKTLKKGRPYIFVSCFILGMLLTPPDVVSQVLLAIPAWILFELGLILGRVLVRDSEKS